MPKSRLESELGLGMLAVLRRALTATMDITRMRARLTGITDLAISTVAYLSAPARGLAGVAADMAGADADITADAATAGVGAVTTAVAVMATAHAEQLAAVVSAVERVADSTAERFTVVAAVAFMAARFTVAEADLTVEAAMVAEATGKI
jgi:hypothetical protein